ncbi:uncharacterized protein LOC126793132 [Argentina anserina]|uniref:uncharacterized protein LOC126793132 n=1 Tax=Argentina anserina TaxID=57926 RepID=UPI00217653DF|nr:uncharacterized protein LOC126793132 [Potentilla anserina]
MECNEEALKAKQFVELKVERFDFERTAAPTMPSAAPSMPSATPAVPAATPTVPAASHAKSRSTHTMPSASSKEHSAIPTQPCSTSHPQKGQKSTFWTICSCCKMYFEYLRTFLNHKLQCHNCRKLFIAHKIPAPKHASKSKPFDPQQQNFSQPTMPKNSCDAGRTHSAATDVRSSGISSLFFNSAGVPSVQATASTSSLAAGSANPAVGQLNREHEESFPSKEGHQAFNKPDPFIPTGAPNAGFSAVPNGVNSVKSRRKRHWWQEMQTKVRTGNGGVAMNNGFVLPKFSSGTGRFDADSNYRLNCRRELSHLELQNMLMKKGKKELVKKLDKFPSVPKTADADVKEKGKNEAAVPGVKAFITGTRVSVDAKDRARKMSAAANSRVDSDVEDGHTNSMSVPDPDFHDFDNDRAEKSFDSNQVWAVYDEDDGMPRYYAMVHSIISLNPFKIRISWLNSKTNHELAPLDWVACGFPKTSGNLQIGKHEVYKYLHSFSHKVKWTKGSRGAVRIYPGKGDVWALYRNWSPSWDEHTADEVIHKYDMVQVLEDYNEERGVSIVPLVKVANFKTVFRQHSDRSRIRTIPREEMFRFSHQVPYYLLTGDEGENAPKGCLELDPASTPLELLQVKTEAQAKLEETVWECNGGENGEVIIETGLVEDGEEKYSGDLMKEHNDPQATEMRVYSRKRPREGQAVEGAKRLQL